MTTDTETQSARTVRFVKRGAAGRSSPLVSAMAEARKHTKHKLGEAGLLEAVCARDPSLSRRHLEWTDCMNGKIHWSMVTHRPDQIKLSLVAIDELPAKSAAASDRELRVEKLLATGVLPDRDPKLEHLTHIANPQPVSTEELKTFEWGISSNGWIWTQLTSIMQHEHHLDNLTPMQVIDANPLAAEHHDRVMRAVMNNKRSILNKEEKVYWDLLILEERLSTKSEGQRIEKMAGLGPKSEPKPTAEAVTVAEIKQLAEAIKEPEQFAAAAARADRQIDQWFQSDPAIFDEGLPYGGATSWTEYDTWLEGREQAQMIRNLADTAGILVTNVIDSVELENADKPTAIVAIARGLGERTGNG